MSESFDTDRGGGTTSPHTSTEKDKTQSSSHPDPTATIKRKPTASNKEDSESRRPLNMWQKLNGATNKGIEPDHTKPPTSTPLVSPNAVHGNLLSPLNSGNQTDELHNHTMLGPFPKINGETSTAKLSEALDILESHIIQYGADFVNNPNNKVAISNKFKSLTSKLYQARLISAEKSNDDLLSRCSVLGSKLEAHKIQWSVSSHNSSLNTSTFDGFTTFDFMKAAANLPTADNNSRLISSLYNKLKALTIELTNIKDKITSSQPDDNIVKRINDFELKINAFCTDSPALQSRVSKLEQDLETLNGSFQYQTNCSFKSAEAHRNLAKEFATYQMSIQSDLEAMQNQIEILTNNAETQQVTISKGLMSKTNGPNADKVSSWLHSTPPGNLQENATASKPVPEAISASDHRRQEELNDNDTESVSSSNTLDVYAKSLKRQMRGLLRLLQPSITDTIDKATLQDLYKNRLSLVDMERRDLQRSLRDYMKVRQADCSLCDNVEYALEEADKWACAIREMYISKGHHKKSQTAKLYEALPKFSPKSEIDIFEYLRRFENLTCDYEIPEEKAELLYSKHLSSSIQDEVVRVKENYERMKLVLIQRYGDLQTITGNILCGIVKDKLSNTSSLNSKLDFYRKLQSSLQKINKLLAIPDVNKEEVEDFIFGHDFLKRLLQLLPEPAYEHFVNSMSDLDQDTKRVRGKIAFKTILNSVNKIYERYDSMARNVDPDFNLHRHKKESSTKHSNHGNSTRRIASDDSSDSSNDPKINVHFQEQQKKERPVSSRQYPCTISGHKHSLSDCVEFFLKSPKERVESRKEIKFKHCTLCLQSNNECRYKKCSNYKAIPKTLVCSDCRELSKTHKKACFSVLYCINEKHSKPLNTDILEALEKYIPGFKSSFLNAPINLASHFQILSLSKDNANNNCLSSPIDDSQSAPIFDTCTGEEVDVAPVDLIHEVDEDCIGVMQILTIKGRDLLTLYDRGANQNLISGEIAEDLNIKVHEREQSSIGVISGNRILTGFGTYELYIGPTSDAKYHQIIAQGMKSITRSFPKYELNDINEEALEFADIHPSSTLPPYVGGACVDLLIGLKDANLEPICVYNLPSGIGLYKSPFKDKFGSVYCYGGPHKIFSDVHKKLAGNVNHMYSFFTEVLNQYKSSPFFSLKPRMEPDLLDTGFGVYQYKEKSTPLCFQTTSLANIYPTPLEQECLYDLGMKELPNHNSTLCQEHHCTCPEQNLVFRAKISLNKQRTFVDEEDKDELINFRCSKCLKCKCASSNTSRMMSITEKIEQEAIEKSVSINLKDESVYVDLPFTKDPTKFLTAKHGTNNNYHQSLKVYLSQCKLPESQKEGIRTVMTDLQQRGFLKKLSDLPTEHQNLIKESSFQHYMPWRTVGRKTGTTKLRVVVDPSMSGLNLILAKGENRIKKLTDILLRSRIKKYSWSSDITKLYNCLKLNPSSYAFQMFMYHDELNPDKPPEIYILIVAWYGVSPSSNQAIFALEEIARLQKEEFPLAYTILSEEIYVDDILSGCDTEEERNQQILEVKHVLASGGFHVKYVLKSGDSSEDDNSIKILGYQWNHLKDQLGPGFSELNFNRKKRGLKDPNPFPVSRPEDVSQLLQNLNISRRTVISKIAEFWEPLGIWEPFKVQLKLSAQALNSYDWEKPLTPEMQEYWLSRFQQFLDLPKLSVSRYIFPKNAISTNNIRLLCLSDAGAKCGGAAIYAGVMLQDGTYSCQLIASRSKLIAYTIPRNELESIRLAANLAYEVKQALGDRVKHISFFTDSSIALSWCHNIKKKLRLFVLNRVSEIRRIISSLCESKETLPLYHIETHLNTADLLTKPSDLKPLDLHAESTWISGQPWMKSSEEVMPITTFSDLQLSAQQNQLLNQECFPDILLPSKDIFTIQSNNFNHCKGCSFFQGCTTQQVCHGNSPVRPHCNECFCSEPVSFACQSAKGKPMLDIICHGYSKSLKIMSHIIEFTWYIRHKFHKSRGVVTSQDCPKCKALIESSQIPTEYSKVLKSEALNYFLREESKHLQQILPKDKLANFHMKDGILMMSGRLPEEAEISTKDLDFKVFFDNTSIKGVLPVVSAESDLFYALLMDIHHTIRKHAGIEITLREISKTVFPIHNAKRVIQLVRKSCPRCRLILRQTLELTIGNHPNSRMQIAPPFYHCMADICYGFKGKSHRNARNTRNSNTHYKIYALVIVCLLTSATSILALESIETQEVVMALERHSARYGIPSAIFVDNGTQLTSLNSAEFSIRDANNQLRESVGLEIIPSVAKSHCERGRVERKIRTLREMLLKTSINTDIPMTALQWETVFQKLASEIDEIPIARTDKAVDNDIGWELLTPNRFKLGRSNCRSIEGIISISPKSCPTHLLRKIHEIQSYWYQLLLDRLHHLIPSSSKWNKSDPIQVNDIIVFRLLDNTNSKLEKWSIGKISNIENNGRRILCSYPVTSPDPSSPDGLKTKLSYVFRSPRDICIISSADDIPLNSREFFSKIKRVAEQ